MFPQRLRADIFDATGLTASAGIACNRMLAKIASDMNKPNGGSYSGCSIVADMINARSCDATTQDNIRCPTLARLYMIS